MPFPQFDFCIICDGVRQEVAGKFTILGFYGLTPNVEVVIANLALPLTLALIAGFPPVAEVRAIHEHSIVVNKPDDTVLQRTPPSRLNVVPGSRGLVIFGFVIPPPFLFGTYTIRILVDNESKLQTSLRLRSPSPGELPGIVLPPPPGGRPN